jgi:Flp pilus assembly protein TadG
MLRKRDDRGASAVEFALVVPILAMLLIGIVTVAIVYNDKLALANAVREGARIGATLPNGSTWGSSVQTHVATAYADDASNVSVCAKLYKVGNSVPLQSAGSGCGTEPDAPNGVTGCYVKVWASKPAAMDWILGRRTFTIGAQSVAIYDRSESC